MKDWILLAILGGVVALGLGIWAITSGGSGSSYERLRNLELPAMVRPAGEASGVATTDISATEDDRNLSMYLDVSESMAGYLPVAEGEGKAGFRTVVHLVPDHLLRLYGPIASVRWLAVDNQLRAFAAEPRFRLTEFRGAETYLDLAVADAITKLRSREIEAAAVVTDLVATREVSGALGLYNAIREWLRSPDVRGAELDLGLLGVRVPFRGVANGKCRATGGLGCWYSERARAWQPLTASADRPFYILILGRSGIEVAAEEPEKSLVHRAGNALLKDVLNLGFEARWEMLTTTARRLPATVECRVEAASGKEQYALLRSPEGRYRCQQDQRVLFVCELTPGVETNDAKPPIDLRPTAVQVSWPEKLAESQIAEGQIKLEVDCGELRRKQPGEALRFTMLQAESVTSATGWAEWSVESDEFEETLGRTLQLRHFVEGTRPDGFEVEVLQALLGENS